ncbi:MAG: CoA transferase [Dehalococcoidia bacterium]
MVEAEPRPGPLADVRVVDLAGESGVFAGRLFAELGADVIRVEPPGGDRVRARRPFIDGEPGVERSLYHQHFNAQKRAITLDICRPQGAELMRRLVRVSDVLIETGAPGELAALGLGAEALRGEQPGLIYLSIAPFGQTGPMAGYRATDLIASAMSGLMYLNGYPEDPPAMPGAEQAYHMGALAAVAGALLALVGRDRDAGGAGRHVDVSLQEAASMATLQTANANYYTWHREVPVRHGLTGTAGGRSLYQCRDGRWVSFVLPPPFWDHFIAWLDEEGIAHELHGGEWRELRYRTQHAEPVSAAVSALAARFDRTDLFREGQRRRLLVMPVNTVADLLEDAQLRDRRFFTAVDHPELGRTLVDSGVAYRLQRTPARLDRRAPLLGEHNAAVFGDLLGVDEQQRAELARAGVI